MYEWGGLFDLTMHPQLIGQPSRLLWLRRLIHFRREHPNVWWATGSEIAQHRLAMQGSDRNAPAPPPSPGQRPKAVRSKGGGAGGHD